MLAAMRAALFRYSTAGATVLDPFAGVGGIHTLRPEYVTYAIELEPEWAMQSALQGWTWCGDFFEFDPPRGEPMKADRDRCFTTTNTAVWGAPEPGFPMPTTVHHSLRRFNVIATSPTYGNRMADHHEAKDSSTRITYRHKLGRALSANNSGSMHFNSHAYKSFHHRAWERCHELLYVNGLFLLNVSDFIAKGEVVHASAWHLLAMRDAGFKLVRTYDMPTPRMRFGANANARVEFEHVHVFRKVAS